MATLKVLALSIVILALVRAAAALSMDMREKNSSHSPTASFCTPGDKECWPDDRTILYLMNALNPSIRRRLSWPGNSVPQALAIPLASNNQPLYGLGEHYLRPLYVRDPMEARRFCFLPLADPNLSHSCLASTRHAPYNSWHPFLTVFPVTIAQIKTVLDFSKRHRLCVSVAGSGTDRLNRHTACEHSLMIRTALFKNISVDLDDKRHLGHANIRIGPGVTASEVQHAAAVVGHYVVGPWSPGTGMVGWSIGGGMFVQFKGADKKCY